LNCAFYSHWPLSTGEILSLISIVDWIPRETRSAAFAIVLGVRSRSSRVRSWIWVEAPRRWTERDLANFATYIPLPGSIGSKPGGLVHPLPGRLVPSPEGWYILCRGRLVPSPEGWYSLCRGRLVPSPEGWYILCRGRRPRLQMQNKIREARRADTQDLLRLMDAQTGGYHHRQRLCQPSGLDECQSVWINLYCI
jgi:hypothetical protein